MVTFFNNLKIRSKIYAGFGIVLAALVLTIGIVFSGLQEIDRDFIKVDELISAADVVGELQTKISESEAETLIWLRTQDPETLEEVKKQHTGVIDHLDMIKGIFDDPVRLQEFREIEAAYNYFYEGLLKVESYIAQRNDLVFNIMDKIGPQARRMISEVGEGAYKDGDYETASHAGVANQYLLLTRFYANKFLLENNEEDYKSFEKHWASLQMEFERLDKSVQNPQRRELLANVRDMMPEYKETFEKAHEIILARNELIEISLIANALEITESVNKIQDSVTLEKDRYTDEFYRREE
jgi:methyl-accepting chemotaxis protein